MALPEVSAADSGFVELLQLQWPPEDPGATSIACYLVMRRPGGFLLCAPVGSIDSVTLAEGLQGDLGSMVGPSCIVSASAVSLAPGDSWVASPLVGPVPALLVDLSDAAAPLVSPLEGSPVGLVPFVSAHPLVYPLAAEIVEQAATWLQGALGEQMGYETALETAEEQDPALGPRARTGAKPKPKKPTVAGLAAQQTDLAGVVASLVSAVQELRAQPRETPAPLARPPPGLPLVPKAAARDLSSPIGAGLGPGFQDSPADLARLLGGPPPVRALRATAAGPPAERDEDLSLIHI